MKRYSVKEGTTGVLELTDDAGNVEIYQPDCDIDKAQTLLYQFYNVQTSSGMNVKDAFIRKDIDWFPTTIGMLCWQYFYQVVKYRPLLEKYLLGQVEFKSISPGKFYNLIQIILEAQGKDKGKSKVKKLIRTMYASIIQIRNRLVPNKQGDLLFFRYGLDDFRTEELLEQLENEYKVLQVTGVSYKKVISIFFNRNIYILPLVQPSKNNSVLLNHGHKDLVFKYAMFFAESIVNTHRFAYGVHLANFRHFEYKLFFGLDDANTVYPLIYAAQDTGIKALGFQHGLYAQRQEAYVMQGIERYRWYDNVLVWGEYWKSNLLKNSSLYSSTYHIVSSNKHCYDYKSLLKQGKNRVILIPYEFLSDSIKVGEYIKKFIKAGFKILFKSRADELLQDQLDPYFLGEFEDEIEILDVLTPEAMAEVDVIAGTQTTLLFDLLPYNKPIWILESPFRLMYDMVEDGFARLITESDMQRIDAIFEEDISEKKPVNAEYFSGKVPMVDAVANYLDVGVSKK
tara:strand:+ start:15139 stop:16671 length:1533 start_codon:yes stop_codon:yes gene_type:complete